MQAWLHASCSLINSTLMGWPACAAAPYDATYALGCVPPGPFGHPQPQVGNQFVSQYYTVQHASPKHLHRFYSDASTLTYGDVRPEGCVTRTATGQKVQGGRLC